MNDSSTNRLTAKPAHPAPPPGSRQQRDRSSMATPPNHLVMPESEATTEEGVTVNPLLWLQQSATGFKPGWGLSTVWGIILGSFAVTGMGAIIWLTRLPPPPECDRLSAFAADVDVLYCAERLAASGELADLQKGLDLVTTWPPDHLLYDEAQELLQRWSGSLLLLAEDQLATGDVERAIATANLVPVASDQRGAAQTAIAQWRAEWQQGNALVQGIETAIAQQQWSVANTQLKALLQLNHDYWVSSQGGRLRQTIQREQQAHTQLTAARVRAATGNPEDIGAAIALAQDISFQATLWSEAKRDIDRWSKVLLDRAFAQWEAGNEAAAIAIAQQVPADPALTQEAKDLIQISYAEEIATAQRDWLPSFLQIFQLQEAIAALDTLPTSSSFYDRAQIYLAQWREEVQDLTQLQYAYLIAQGQTKWHYQLAMQQADLLTPARPRRTQAQTLVAHWRQEIERIEDQPYLDQASQIAQVQTIPALQNAIATAQQIRLGRALRGEAQNQIAIWGRQIQVLEDQPILTAAADLANTGKLTEAIAKAQTIATDRALYTEAQTQIRGWTTQLQIAQDRPIMTRANGLAGQGSLTAAIEVAAQIAPGRALYNEAQSSITIWEKERAAIWATWAAEEALSEGGTEDYYGEEEGVDDGYYDDGYNDGYYDDGY